MARHIKLNTIIFIIISLLSFNSYSLDELDNKEMAGLAYLNIPFSGPVKSNFSPTFGLAVTQVRPAINNTYTLDISPLLPTSNKRKMVDIQFNLEKVQFSRFAFGGVDALVHDYTMHADGGGPVIDPGLVILGIGSGALIYLILTGDDDEGNGQNNQQCQVPFAYTSLNLNPCNITFN